MSDRPRDQGYGNRQPAPVHSPQRNNGNGNGSISMGPNGDPRRASGRAPLPEGREMALDGERAGSVSGSIGGATPSIGGGKDDGTPLNINRTPQQILTGLPATGPDVPPPSSASFPPPNQNVNGNGYPPVHSPSGNNNGPPAGLNDTLETFNIATFNPMSPDSWAALGRAYKNTTGREPGQMDLMGFLAGQGPVPLPGTGGGGGMGMNMGMGMGANGGMSGAPDQGGFGGSGMGGMGGMGNQGGTGGMNMGMGMGMPNVGGGPGGFGMGMNNGMSGMGGGPMNDQFGQGMGMGGGMNGGSGQGQGRNQY